jgi:hypothetical protein
MPSIDIGTNDEENQEKLPGDYDRPFSLPDDVPNTLPKDHPGTDYDLDKHELYDEGRDGAAEQSDPLHEQ